MAIPANSVNAWILPSEDEPGGTGYNDPTSCFQTLITYGVYKSVDLLFICFLDTCFTQTGYLPTDIGYSIALGDACHPNNVSNQQYMQWIIQDARAANPNIKVLVTMGYSAIEISQLFYNRSGQEITDTLNSYAANLVAFMQANDLDGLDVDWEPALSETSQSQFAQAFTAIGEAFQNASLLLTMCPSTAENLDAPTVNAYFDMVTLQVYGGAQKSDFTGIGINADLLAFGAKFESAGNGDTAPYQDAQGAYQQFTAGGYTMTTQWRLNSGDYQFEQAQQMIYSQLVKGVGDSFDDTPIVGAAGNPPITSMTVRSGEVLDSIQATNTGSFDSNTLTYTLLQHGGDGGVATPITIDPNDPIVTMSGYTGVWYGWNCVLQLSLTTKSGQTFGPFGTMQGATSQTPFSVTAPAGQSIVAFSGTTVSVPEAVGPSPSLIVATLSASFG